MSEIIQGDGTETARTITLSREELREVLLKEIEETYKDWARANSDAHGFLYDYAEEGMDYRFPVNVHRGGKVYALFEEKPKALYCFPAPKEFKCESWYGNNECGCGDIDALMDHHYGDQEEFTLHQMYVVKQVVVTTKTIYHQIPEEFKDSHGIHGHGSDQVTVEVYPATVKGSK